MANKTTWKRRIRKACREAGTYEPFFDLIIDQLSELMETKDRALEMYAQSGGAPVVAYTNKGGHTNLRKNPALQVINECNQQALAYWRDLGLTPSGFKKLGNEMVSVKKEASLGDLLSKIGI